MKGRLCNSAAPPFANIRGATSCASAVRRSAACRHARCAAVAGVRRDRSQREGQADDRLLDGRRAAAYRHVRHEARLAERLPRRVQADQVEPAGPRCLRADAEAREDGRQVHDHSLDHHDEQAGRPRPGADVLADRQPAAAERHGRSIRCIGSVMSKLQARPGGSADVRGARQDRPPHQQLHRRQLSRPGVQPVHLRSAGEEGRHRQDAHAADGTAGAFAQAPSS